jgi:hypothetical protein
MKCPRLYLCLVHFHSISFDVDATHAPINHKWYDPLHISRDRISSSILTSLALHRCFGPLTPSHHSTCPWHLQSVYQAKSCFDLLHLDHMTPCHVSCAMNSFITCVSFATFLSHFHLRGICCSHTCTCVSHSNIISPPKVVTQLPKPNKDLSISPFLVIDDNSTKIWKLSTFGFVLLAQAILPCVNDFGQVPQILNGSISSPTYVLECLV